MNILIVGAGPAGSSLATVLATNGLSVVLVEGSGFQTPRVGELLSPQGKRPLLRILPSAQDFALSEMGVSLCWTGPRLETSQKRDWWALDRLGLDRALAENAAKAGARLCLNSKVRQLERQDGRWSYQLITPQGAEQARADLVVDASGRASKIGRSLGAYRQRLNLQTALVGFLKLPQDGQTLPSSMLLEAVPTGWWYAAPLRPDTAVATFVTDTDLDRGLAEQAWRAALDSTIHLKVGLRDYTLCEPPRRVASGASYLQPAYGPGWVTVGDAATAFDPLANYGVGQAIDDATQLGELLVEARASGRSPRIAEFCEERGGFFSDVVEDLGRTYRQVQRWPDSPFWSRRSHPEESQSRAKLSRTPERTLIFPKGQKFSCTRCGKCCRSHWTPEVESPRRARISSSYQALRVLKEKQVPPLMTRPDSRVVVRKDPSGACVFLQNDNLCSLHDPAEQMKPTSCQQFPFLFRDTPQGTVVGVSYLCDAAARNEGEPLESYTEEILALLEHRQPTALSPQVAVTWGRSLNWSQYQLLEEHLLRSDDIAAAARHCRWALSRWVHREDDTFGQEDLLQDSAPHDLLAYLDQLLALALIAGLEEVDPEVSLFDSLLEDRLVHLKKSNWEGTLRSLPEAITLENAPWLPGEVERYLRALIERKFLLVQMPLLSNLCLLSALPQVLTYLTSLNWFLDGRSELGKADYLKALATVEVDLVTYGRMDLPVRTVVKVHLDSAARF